MNKQESHKFYRGAPPPNAWEGQTRYLFKKKEMPESPKFKPKQKIKRKRNKPATPPKRYYA